MTERTLKGRDLSRGERLQIMLNGEELQALDDFRFSNRMPSRAAAVRELLRRGLMADGYPAASKAKSGGYRVVDAGAGNGSGKSARGGE